MLTFRTEKNASLLLLLFSRSAASNSLRLHGLQHSMLPVLHHFPELAHIE